MTQLFLIPVIAFSRTLVFLLRATGKGSGTALPGLLVSRYFPFAFAALVSQIPRIVVITGTNGKTTTQTMLSAILDQQEDITVLRNQAGANLLQGILSQLLREANWLGQLHFSHAILEVEEATLPQIAQVLRPEIITVTNLYRDQLDAYGETDMTERLIRDGITQCPQALVVVNGDDPRTSRLTRGLDNATYFTSLPQAYSADIPYEGETQDTQSRTDNILRAVDIQIKPNLTSDVTVVGSLAGAAIAPLPINIASPGFFHVYNALAAITMAKLLGVGDRAITQGFNNFKPAFGRGEILGREQGNKRVNFQLLLVKNPASLSLSLDLLTRVKRLKIIFAINDNIADSKDVSWLWDSQLERLNQADIDWILCTGIRAKDMKVRLKYALDGSHKTIEASQGKPGVPADLVQQILAQEDIRQAIAMGSDRAQDQDTIYVLPTYTAMLEFRKIMGKSLDSSDL
ncbi:MAG: MurT ligase domain-containing protein [Leptolyngbyaceae bacterium]|nr:MurT ligase domain-containing protein [Leptolyngbyaceae bacterium]